MQYSRKVDIELVRKICYRLVILNIFIIKTSTVIYILFSNSDDFIINL